MAEATGDAVPVENRRPHKELPSFAFFLSLPNRNRTSQWHGQRRLHGESALVEVTAYTDRGGFPVNGTIGVSQGAGAEEWSYRVETHGATYRLRSAHERTLAIPHLAPREEHYDGVELKLTFKKPLRSPREGITPDNIDTERSIMHGSSSGTVREAVQDLCSLAKIIQTSR